MLTNFRNSDQLVNYYSINYSQKMNEKLTYKIKIKSSYIRTDGTSAIFLQIFLNGQKKILPLNLSVPVEMFDKDKQRVKTQYKYSVDYNLIIEKMLADINQIEINYRLNNITLTMDRFLEDLLNPSLRVSFIVFSENLIQHQYDLKIIRKSTYKAQISSLNKIKTFKPNLLFSDITAEFLEEYIYYLKKRLKNSDATIQGNLKNFKKMLHAANKKGIRTKLNYDDISVKRIKGRIVFLEEHEIKTAFEYYKSPFINGTSKQILQQYLFCCFTGLRHSDVSAINEDNIVGDYVVFKSIKTNKLQKVKLNLTAKSLMNENNFFEINITNQAANRILKPIFKNLGIKKEITFHTSRHTFATQFLIKGGQMQNLKQHLGHSKIDTTMIYVHIVEKHLNEDVSNLDNILKFKD